MTPRDSHDSDLGEGRQKPSRRRVTRDTTTGRGDKDLSPRDRDDKPTRQPNESSYAAASPTTNNGPQDKLNYGPTGPPTNQGPTSRQGPSQLRTAQYPAKPAALLTLDEVLEELAVPRSTFFRWKATGVAPKTIKLPNGSLRVRRRDLEKWLAAHEETIT